MSDQIFSTINKFVAQDGPTNVELLARELNIILQKKYLPDDTSGMIEYDENLKKYRITVNASDSFTRQRFTIAHELGHFVYHREKIGNGLVDDRAYRSTRSGAYNNSNIGPAEETQANKFAASLLMPVNKIKKMQMKNIVSPEDLASNLMVSKDAMKIRLEAIEKAEDELKKALG